MPHPLRRTLNIALSRTPARQRADPTNTNVYVGNLGPDTIESDIAAMFSSYGTIAELKLHKKGGFAFVRYGAVGVGGALAWPWPRVCPYQRHRECSWS